MRSSTLFSMGLLALSVSIGVAGCGDDDDDGNNTTAGSAGKGGNTSTAGKGGSGGSSNTTAGKGGSNTTAGKGGTDGGGGEGGGTEPATGGNGPIGGETSGGTGGAAAGADTGGQTGEGGGGGETQAAADVQVNDADVLTNAAGFSLYVFDDDTASMDAPVSACSGGCLGAWPVFLAENPTVSAELDAADFRTFTRGDAAKQTTYKGHPLYRFTGDALPGATNGDGSGGKWHVVKIPFTP